MVIMRGAAGRVFFPLDRFRFSLSRVLPSTMSLRLLAFLSLAAVAAATQVDDAIALYRAKDYPDARAAFEKIVAAEPTNAAACYYLGMTLRHRGDDKALDDALPWLEKAVTLEPNNADYLSDFGGTSLQLASKNTSYTAATKGRDAMEKALKIDPKDLDTRQGLFEFYEQAPWPLGSSAKAAAQVEEIRKLDPDRAAALSVRMKTDEKDYAGAFKICEGLLAKNPNDYTALYQYGRTSSLCGQNLEHGLACLQKVLTLPPPSPASPTASNVWNRIGVIRERLGQTPEARTAYQTALKLEPTNRQAADALSKLK
jgi:tetratricopeptide (TPR) repeat protein